MNSVLEETAARQAFLPYGRQQVTEEDIQAVVEVLRSDWLTQGPTIELFERALAKQTGAKHVVACANGTAALHLAMMALGIGEGDTVVTSPNSFVASANCALYVDAGVEFADIDVKSGIMSLDRFSELVESDTVGAIKAVVPVHFAGQTIDMARLRDLVVGRSIAIVEDACHALGGSYEANGSVFPVGSCEYSDMTVFSFHPVKHVAAGEGGAVSTNDDELARRIRSLRSHGVVKSDFVQPQMSVSETGAENPWYYEMQRLGFNYRLTDIQAALGLSQLKRLEKSVERRNEIARLYDRLLREKFYPAEVTPLLRQGSGRHAYHLYVVLIDFNALAVERAKVMNRLHEQGVGTQVHYIPIHLQPYYRQRVAASRAYCPNAEAYYERALSLPMYPGLSDEDVERVVDTLADALNRRSGR